MSKKLEKYETLICILVIVFYLLLNSYCINNFGTTNYLSVICNSLFSISIIIYILRNNLGNYYGLTTLPKAKDFLYYIPLILIISCNLWNGISINNTVLEIIMYILLMINVGFLEEIIFRGFLFKMMAKDNVNGAIIVTSITFGFGHISNLLNGALFLETLMQICYALAIGYLFAIILIKGKSLWPCIVTHALFNSLNIFNNGSNGIMEYVISLVLIIIPILYAGYLSRKIQ